MKIGLIILAVFAVLIFVLLFAPVRVRLSLVRDETGFHASAVLEYMRVKINLLGGKKRENKKEKPKQKREPGEVSFENAGGKLKKYINIFESIKSDLGKTLDYSAKKAVVFENAGFDAEFGFSDAMHTGIFTGMLNGFVYSVLGFIHHKSVLESMNVNIQPVFEKPCFNVRCGCIVRSKIVHIIVDAFFVLKILKKIRKAERSR